MTLAQCLEEIKKIYLSGDVEAMTNLGIGLVHELRERFYPDYNYPKTGWLLYCREDSPCLCHKKLKIIVKISFDNQSRKEIFNKSEILEDNNILQLKPL